MLACARVFLCTSMLEEYIERVHISYFLHLVVLNVAFDLLKYLNGVVYTTLNMFLLWHVFVLGQLSNNAVKFKMNLLSCR